MKKKIKIFCTLGPSSLNSKFLKFSSKKVDLLRLNMSHVKLHILEKTIKKIRKFTNVPICVDTEGAQIRTKVSKSKKFKVGSKIIINKTKNIHLYPKYVFDLLKKGDVLSFGFEGLKAKINKKNKNTLIFKCISSGLLETNKGVHIHNRKIKLNYLTEKDFKAIEIGKKMKIKHYALSFTNNQNDIIKFNSLLPKETKYFKIETREALNNFKQMIKRANNFLIDRGDLSKDLTTEQIPIAQRFIFNIKEKKTNVAIATHFLESMINKPFPTKAEANDIYSSMGMGAYAMVLAAETAVGKYPEECVKFLLKIIKKYLNKKNYAKF